MGSRRVFQIAAALQCWMLSEKRLTANESEHLDGWRGASALAVFVSHAVQIFGQTASWIRAMAIGSVMVFFVLSGFFIQKSAARSFGSGRPYSFLVNRANRLLPPFALAMALVVALWAAAPFVFASGSRDYLVETSRSNFSIDGWLETALLVNAFVGRTISANAPLWSLSYEVGYYMLAWLLMCLVTGRQIGLLLIPCAAILVLKYHDVLVLGSVWGAGFLIGVLHANDRLFRPNAYLFTASLACMVLFYVLGYESWWFQLAVGALTSLALIRVLTTRVRRLDLLAKTAAFSYSLYILHFPMLLFAYGAFGESRWMLLPTMLIVLGIAGPIGVRLEQWHPFGRRNGPSGGKL